MSLNDLKPGDVVVLNSWRHVSREVVAKVGRVWITLRGRSGKFSKQTGALENYSQNYIQTEEQYEKAQHLVVVQKELNELGIDTYRLPNNKLEAILEALRPILASEKKEED